MTQSLIDKLTSTQRGQQLLRQEELILEVTEWIVRLMDEKRINKAHLARKLGKTKGYVTQLLGGNTNMTLRTISDVFCALDTRVELRCAPVDETPAFDSNLVGVGSDAHEAMATSQEPWKSSFIWAASSGSIALPAIDRLKSTVDENWGSTAVGSAPVDGATHFGKWKPSERREPVSPSLRLVA